MAWCVWCGAEIVDGGRFCPKCGKASDLTVVPGKCPQCGALNATAMKKCGDCGTVLPEVFPRELPRRAPMKRCKWCSNEAEPGSDQCQDCSRRQADVTVGRLPRRKCASGGLAAGAVLCVISGGLALLQGLTYMALRSSAFSLGFSPEEAGVLSLCGLTDMLLGLGAMAGGYFAFRRSNFPLALIGAVVGMLGLGFIIGGLFGLIALLLIATSRQDFD